MAHQDYVARSASKKKSPYKKSSEAQTAHEGIALKTKVVAVITLLAVSAFSYGLWTIKDKQPEHSVSASKPAPKETTKLPAPPKEKWAYVKELESKEVDEGEYTVESTGPHKLQCGSFRTMKQAEVLKAKIAFVGLESQISSAKGTTGTWYKVFLGPYTKKRDAERDKHKLSSNNVNHCKIWLWR
ncbi:SPOR domain-containing protein [Thalassotalea fusca]